MSEYFSDAERKVVLVCGAGFDPRSTNLCRTLKNYRKQLTIQLIREIRPNPHQTLLSAAEDNIRILTEQAECHLLEIDILGDGNAVVGGANLVKRMNAVDWAAFTDIVVDASAISVGLSFPLMNFLVRLCLHNPSLNLHLFVNQNAALDAAIIPQPVETPSLIYGFYGRLNVSANQGAARLWAPQLAPGRNVSLQKIHRHYNPHDTCPILPFPSANPRTSDEITAQYLEELDRLWSVDPSNRILAAEDDPLDLYRILVRLSDLRKQVFAQSGGSLLILTPTGSKLLAMGSLLAALERNLPVVYLESLGYDFHQSQGQRDSTDGGLVHIWLEGDAYPSSRIALSDMMAT